MALDPSNPAFQGERLRDLVLCYAGPWAFLPYLRSREDEELSWHSRQGVLLAFLECTMTLLLVILGFIPLIGYLSLHILLPLWLLWCLVESVAAILQACRGKRHLIPVLHQFVDFI